MASEREWTAELAGFFATRRRDVVLGVGDDAAVVRPRSPELVLACDPVIEGVHFESEAPAAWVGRKAVNRNLSDLAAMGATPEYLLLSAVLPHGLPAVRRRRLFAGVRDAAEAASCAVVGGDVAATTGPMVLTITAVGRLEGRALRRDGARVGDTIHVTGPLGGSSLGHHLRFSPHLAEGRWLARQAAVTAAIDVSDGLLLDLQRLLDASGGWGADLSAAAVPVSKAAARLGRSSGRTALSHALGDGEDHVLLFTVRAGASLPRRGPLAGCARAPLGVVARHSGLRLHDDGGEVHEFEPRGFDHRL